jgi:hypothetical protein
MALEHGGYKLTALRLSELPAEEFVGTLLPTMFASQPVSEDVDAFRASMLAFHPVGFRAMPTAGPST